MDMVFGATQGEFESYIGASDYDEFDEVQAKPEAYDLRTLKRRILPEGLGQKDSSSLNVFSEEDIKGEKRYFCTMDVKVDNGDATKACYYAPMVVYAIYFGWQEELEAMLEAGFQLAPSMKLVVAERDKNSLFIRSGRYVNVLSVSLVSLLLSRKLKKELLVKCVGRLAECKRAVSHAMISIESVFYDVFWSDLKKGRNAHIPELDDVDFREMLKKLPVLHERFPELFGAAHLRPEVKYKQIFVDPAIYLDAMLVFSQIYGDEKENRELLFRRGMEYLDFLDRNATRLVNNCRALTLGEMRADGRAATMVDAFREKVLEKGGVDYLLQRWKKLCGGEADECAKKFIGKYVIHSVFFLTLCTGNQFPKYEIGAEKPAIKKIVQFGKDYCKEADVNQFFMDMWEYAVEQGGDNLSQNADDCALNIWVNRILCPALDTYKCLTRKRPVVAGTKALHVLNVFLKKLVQELYNEFEMGYGLLNSDFRCFFEKIEKVDYKYEEEKVGMLAPSLKEIMINGSEELVRECVRVNLICRKYVEDNMEEMLKGPERKYIPLLALRKHEVI